MFTSDLPLVMINIYPDKKQFAHLSRDNPRLPIAGVKEVTDLDPAVLFYELFSEAPFSFLLESVKGPTATSRFSIFGCGQPVSFPQRGNGFDLIDSWGFDPGGPTFEYLPHFWGGWVGLLSYESLRWLEPVTFKKKEPEGFPEFSFMQVDQFWIYDHLAGLLKYIQVLDTTQNTFGDYEAALASIEQNWEVMDRTLLKTTRSFPAQPSQTTILDRSDIKSYCSRDEYETWVTKALNYIEEGDVYQANLAQKFETSYKEDPFELYLRLREINPSPFAGFMRFEERILVSASPERLVRIEGDSIETRPIAGTRPRGADFEEDKRLSNELLLNEKEKAEHLMLVDLERNDMGRICQFGSVRVTDLMFLEHYSHVHHIVSNIKGCLKPSIRLSEILRAVFPGGTITGCPKIRCMEIIDELETVSRGPYCGSMGYIGYGPHLDLNIIIRSLLIQNKTASFHVGAGIVADSDPGREYEETLAKAAAMILALFPSKR